MKSDRKAPLDGPHKELFADGGLSGEGRIKAGKRHGKWTFYYKSGGPKSASYNLGIYVEDKDLPKNFELPIFLMNEGMSIWVGHARMQGAS